MSLDIESRIQISLLVLVTLLMIGIISIVGCGDRNTDLVLLPTPTAYIAKPTHFPIPSSTETPSPTATGTPDDDWNDVTYCNDSHTKVLICHVQSNEQAEVHKELLCVKISAARTHLQHHQLDFLIVDHDSAEGCTEE